MELPILRAMIDDRSAYEAIAAVYAKDDFSSLVQQVFHVVRDYYNKDSSAQYMPVDMLESRLCRAYPKHQQVMARLISNLPSEVSANNVLHDYYNVKRDNIGDKLAAHLLEHDHAKAATLLDQYLAVGEQGEAEDEIQIYNDGDLSILDKVSDGQRIKIFPSFLNQFLNGGLIRGSHTVIYAPPECGKTLVAINMTYGICRYGCKTLYIGNEDPEALYIERLLCRFSKQEHAYVQANKQAAHEAARRNGWANMHFVKLFPGTIEQVQQLILKVQPDVVVIDQLPNLLLKGKPPPKTEALELLSYHMRMFYSKHNITGISLAQASERAINKLYLGIEDVYYSNIGVQGQADLMIGIGATEEYHRIDRRMFNIVKNKLSGRHDAIPVQIYKQYSGLRGLQ